MRVIGLGSGRCGTKSLAKLLSQCGSIVTHERRPPLPWEVNHFLMAEKIEFLLRDEGDVGSYYLPYVPEFHKHVPGLKFVCLKRDREDTIESFLIKTQGKNHFITANPSPWDPMFPTYETLDRREGFERYYDEYYEEAERLSKEYPLMIFPTEKLNTPERNKIFEFLEIPKEKRHSNRVFENTLVNA